MRIFKNYSIFSLMCCVSLTCTSCATIVHGTRQSVSISSMPSDACVWVDRTFVGRTPIIVEMTRKDNHVVCIQLDGYQPYEAVFTRQVSGWVFGNIVFGGVIGLAVDAITGGIYKLTPEQVHAQMAADSMAYTKQSSDSYIAVVLNPDPSWEKVGSLTKVNE